jgi:hypothetical protein
VAVFEGTNMYRQGNLRTCLDELERTGDAERLKQEYPQFIEQIQSFWNARRLLEGSVPQLEDERLLTRKQEFLTTIAAARPRPKGILGMLPIRLAGMLGIGGVLVAASLGASAAGLGPAQRAGKVLESMGVNHGNYVSDAVQEAKDGTPPGPERGEAVSTAACEAAHDRSTLPQGAQDASGQADKDAKDCSKSVDAENTDSRVEQANQAAPGQDLQTIYPGQERGLAACAAPAENRGNHGQAVGHASAQAVEQKESRCDDGKTEASEQGQGSGGKPADLPAPAGRP